MRISGPKFIWSLGGETLWFCIWASRRHEMTDSLFLTQDEMVELTGFQRSSAQARALRTMGVEHKIRADGRVLVLRKHIEELFGAHKRKEKEHQWTPSWEAGK